MGKHGSRGHKKSTAFSNSTSGGLGYTLNKELKKQFTGTHKAGVDGVAMSTRHTTADDGGNLQSVTEMTDLEALMQRASSLAGGAPVDEYTVVGSECAQDAGGDSGEEEDSEDAESGEEAEEEDSEEEAEAEAEEEEEEILRLPRRPPWTREMTASELDAREQASFLRWRRRLADFEERQRRAAGASAAPASRQQQLTPFEKNLQVWRQLWRVIERSDLVVQIVDARDPLMYRCTDLEEYVMEHVARGDRKRNFLLLNKADMLPVAVRRAWAEHFRERGVRHAFWSAKAAGEDEEQEEGAPAEGPGELRARVAAFEPERVLDRGELLALLEVEAARAAAGPGAGPVEPARVVVGLVGYPNVGKSSTINTLVGTKKTMVSATPGKTKHFQTLIISDALTLCDCPGLVFPSIGGSKAEMVAAGVLPVDRLTDVRTPVGVIAGRVTRRQLEAVYNISLPRPKLHEDPDRPPTGAEVVVCFALSRGLIAPGGAPDQTRTGRLIIKDYINGKLVHFRMPPGAGGEGLRFEDMWTRMWAEAGGAAAGEGGGAGERRQQQSAGRSRAEAEQEHAEDGILVQDVIAQTAGKVQAPAFRGGAGARADADAKKSHKKHFKANKRAKQPKNRGGYGYHDVYES